jgi:hypothetical protein
METGRTDYCGKWRWQTYEELSNKEWILTMGTMPTKQQVYIFYIFYIWQYF